MNFQPSQRKSLGALYRAEKTKPRSPDMTGKIKIQPHTLRELCELSHQCDKDGIDCPMAAWVNGEPGRQYFTIELSPPYRPRLKTTDPGPTLDAFFAEISGEQE